MEFKWQGREWGKGKGGGERVHLCVLSTHMRVYSLARGDGDELAAFDAPVTAY